MQLSTTEYGNVTVITIDDSLDATTAQQAGDYFAGEIEGGKTNIVVNLGGVTYLSSAGIRAILVAMQQVRTAGGDLRLAGAAGNILNVVEISGLTKIMKTFSSTDESVASYRSS